MLDRLVDEELGMHVAGPGDEPGGIEDHRLDDVPAGDEALGSRRNQCVDLLDKTDLLSVTATMPKWSSRLMARGWGCLNMMPESRERGCKEDTSFKTQLYQKKSHMSRPDKYLLLNFFELYSRNF